MAEPMTVPEQKEEIIHVGQWAGLGEMYNVFTGNGYTTIVVRREEQLADRVRSTWEKFGYSPSVDTHAVLTSE